MAWIISSSSTQNGTFVPVDGAAFHAHMDALKMKRFGRLGDTLLYTSGVPLSPPPGPGPLRLRNIGHVPYWFHLLSTHAGIAVSDTVRGLIEAVEPGEHAFYPVQIDYTPVPEDPDYSPREGHADIGPMPEPYFLINIQRCIRALDLERGEADGHLQVHVIPEKTRPFRLSDYRVALTLYPRPDLPPRLFVDTAAIKGRAVWQECGGNDHMIFMSDALVEQIRALPHGFGGLAPKYPLGEV